MEAFQYVVHAVLVVMGIHYMRDPDSTIWVALMLILTPVGAALLEGLTNVNKSFHLYVAHRLVVAVAICTAIAVWKREQEHSILLIQLVFLTVAAS